MPSSYENSRGSQEACAWSSQHYYDTTGIWFAVEQRCPTVAVPVTTCRSPSCATSWQAIPNDVMDL